MAVNLGFYDPGVRRWSMTERGAAALSRDAGRLSIGPSALTWDGTAYRLDFDEVAVPRPPGEWLPKRLRGRITIAPETPASQVMTLDRRARHSWWPLAPLARISVERDDLHWQGHGYLDSNWGSESLEAGFRSWTWARGRRGQTAHLLYDATLSDGTRHAMALSLDAAGRLEPQEMPPAADLPRGFWHLPRSVGCEAGGAARLLRILEDSPFYCRSLVETQIGGAPLTMIQESLDCRRFASPLVRLLLPFRMPRRAGLFG